MCDMEDPKQQPQLLEPEKCEAWVWRTLDEVKQFNSGDLFLPIQNLLKKPATYEAINQTLKA
ncbi:Nudix hydrolase 1 [Cytospora mali]|uniref:Nudix hydrolase 1 n=1 Tax=Cytospora mali TaxID=578113 RepID=A0A194V786_CYTMA|nr:Nudix hydrolase 1 [Valsa mali var. pyri (nom. inval.)]